MEDKEIIDHLIGMITTEQYCDFMSKYNLDYCNQCGIVDPNHKHNPGGPYEAPSDESFCPQCGGEL